MSIKKDVIKYLPRQEQQNTLDFIKKVCEEKKDNKFFFLNLPVGSGKSHIAVLAADYFLNKTGENVDVITAGKILQAQYCQNYDEIKSLKGKENYECAQYSCNCHSGKEFNKLNKTTCEFCPYEEAKMDYIDAEVSLTNFHLYLINTIYETQTAKMRNAKMLIVDEAHQLDQVMSDFISIKVTETVIKKYNFANEFNILGELKQVNDIDSYIEFLKMLLQEIHNTINDADKYMSAGREDSSSSAKRDKRVNKLNSAMDQTSTDVKLMQTLADLKIFFKKVDIFLKEYEENPDNWVLESVENFKTKHTELSLEPIWADKYLQKYVWSKYDMVILMSGTILDKQLFARINGIDVNQAVYYSIPSPFHLDNRKIFYMPVGKMSFKEKEETFKKYIPILNKLLDKYHDKKGLIHTNSFAISQWIERDLDNPRLVYHTSENKEEVLRMHFESKLPVCLVSPSVSTGVSFDDDAARWQVIAKIPYPSLASIKTKKRLQQLPEWYSYMTVSTIIQMSGRIIRSKVDFGDTIIIDESFSDVMRSSSRFFPLWFSESIKKIDLNGKKAK